MTDTARARTYTWADPTVLATAAAGESGLEFLNKIGSGEYPAAPVASTTGIEPVAVGDGWATFELAPQEWHYNPIGSVHGGILSTLADTALGCAVHTKLPAGVRYTSLDLTIKFTRAATLAAGLLTCTGTVITIGRRTATAEGRIVDAADRTIAHAVTTCLIMRE